MSSEVEVYRDEKNHVRCKGIIQKIKSSSATKGFGYNTFAHCAV